MNMPENNTTHTDVEQVKKRWEYPELVPINDLEIIHKLEEDVLCKEKR